MCGSCLEILSKTFKILLNPSPTKNPDLSDRDNLLIFK